MVINELISMLNNVKSSNGNYTARCPAHDDNHSSLSVSESSDRKILLHCHAGCSVENIVQALNLQMADLFPTKGGEKKQPPKEPTKKKEAAEREGNEEKKEIIKKLPLDKKVKPEAEYFYYNLDGDIVHKTIRYGKQYSSPFAQARPHPTEPGKWLYNLRDIKTVLYKLQQVDAAIKQGKPVFIVEGEKDADNMEKWGFTATTNPMGAGKWRMHYSDYLLNGDILIVPDNDDVGRQHAEKVANLLFGKIKTVKILDLRKAYPDIKPKGDITDFFEALGEEKARQLLNGLIETTPGLTPPPAFAEREPEKVKKFEIIDNELNKFYLGTMYFIKDCCLWRYGADGENKFLADFTPIPTATIKKDDGATVEAFFKIKAIGRRGKQLPETIVTAEKFTAMQWVTTAWGFDANYAPGTSTKDFIRHAITSVGACFAKSEDIYTHTGWRKINEKWAYLYNGGAIGADGVFVELDASLSDYAFPERELNSMQQAYNFSKQFVSIAPQKITLPLISIAYISPLNEFMRQSGCEPAYIIYLLGITGAWKSTLAALTLCHFGSFTGKNLPGSFKDTSNSLEKKGFLLKDTLTVIDDYHPTLQRNEASKMEKTAQEITRSYGDRTGRGRMNSDTTLRNSYVPRGNLIVTGEDVPNIGQSGVARHLMLELKKGDVDKDKLSYLQNNAENLSAAMRGYIEWVRAQTDSLPAKLKEMFLAYRNKAQDNTQHARMPDTVAWLQIGYDMFIDYGVSIGNITAAEAKQLKINSFLLFMQLAAEQSSRIENDKPTVKFINALKELLETSACYLINVKDVNEKNQGNEKGDGFIGYYDEQYYYLYGETVFNHVVQFYNQQGVHFPVTKDTLLKQLDIEKLILPEIKDNRVYRAKGKKICGKTYRFVWLKKSALIEPDEPQENNEPSNSVIDFKSFVIASNGVHANKIN